MFLPGLIASFAAIITEKKGRRGTLALYMTNLVCENNPSIPNFVIYEIIFFLEQTSDDSDDIGFVHFVSLTRSFELEIKC